MFCLKTEIKIYRSDNYFRGPLFPKCPVCDVIKGPDFLEEKGLMTSANKVSSQVSLAGCSPLQRSILIHFTFLNSVHAVRRFECIFSPADSFSWLPFFLSVWDRPARWQFSIHRCRTLLAVCFYCWCTGRGETNLTLFCFFFSFLSPTLPGFKWLSGCGFCLCDWICWH